MTTEETPENPSQTHTDLATNYKLKYGTIAKLANHSVATIAYDCGYHLAHESCLEILGEVCCDYMTKISGLLKLTSDTEEWREGESDFVDSLERVFHQLNIPSAANLHQFICKLDAIKKHLSKQAQQGDVPLTEPTTQSTTASTADQSPTH